MKIELGFEHVAQIRQIECSSSFLDKLLQFLFKLRLQTLKESQVLIASSSESEYLH